MTNNNFCPECGKTFSVNAKRCGCGWNKPTVQAPVVADHRCQYHAPGRRCPLPGTISNSCHSGGTWYCTEHWRNLGDPKLGEAILINAEKNYEQIMKDRMDWRRKLYEF